jgi:hypothetical protein
MKYLAIHDRVIERCTEEDIKVLTAKNLDAGNMETASGLLSCHMYVLWMAEL